MNEKELILRIKSVLDSTGFDQTASKAGGLGKALAGAGIGAAAGTAATAIAGIGTAFDDAYDGIAIATGATGDRLEELKQATRDVVSTVPVDFETASAAVGAFGQRMDIVGDVGALSAQVANLSRMTGVDATAAANAAADSFALWGIAAADQSTALDQLFVASQKSGVGFSDLQAAVNNNAAVLKAAGMDYEGAVGLIAELGANGIDAAAVMPGLTRALNDGAKAGKDSTTVLTDLVAQIQGAGSAAEAQGIAVDAFGKSGLKMAEAIRSGAMDVGMLVTGLGDAGGAINDTASSTDDLQQKLDLMKNKVMLAAEGFAPLGMSIAPFASMMPMLGGAIGGIVPLLGTLGTTLTATVIPAATAAAGSFAAMIVPILPIVLAIGAVIAIGVLLYKNWDEIKVKAGELGAFLGAKWEEIRVVLSAAWDAMTAKIGEVWTAITTAISTAVAAIGTIISAAWGLYVQIITTEINLILTVVTTVWTAIRDAITAAIEAIRVGISQGWDRIKEYLTATLDAIAETVRTAWTAVTTAISDALDAIRETVTTVWDAITALISSAVKAVEGVIKTGFEFYRSIISGTMDAIRQVVDVAWQAIKATVQTVVDLIEGIVKGAMQILHGDISGGMETIRAAFQGAWDRMRAVVSDAIEAIVGIASGLVGRVKTAIGDAAGSLASIGADLVAGLQQGFSDAWAGLKEKIQKLASLLPDWAKEILGIHSPSLVFAEIGRDIVIGIAQGVRETAPVLREALSQVFGEAQAVGAKAVAETPGVIAGAARGLGGAQAWNRLRQEVAGAQMKFGPQPGELMDIIQRSGMSMGRRGLGRWMRERGYDEETIEGYMDLHGMRGPKGWLTPEARALFERRRTGRAYGQYFGKLTGGEAGNMSSHALAPDISWQEAPPVGVGLSPKPGPAGTATDPINIRGAIEGRMELAEQVVVNLVVGPREIKMIAEEVLATIEAKLRAAPARP